MGKAIAMHHIIEVHHVFCLETGGLRSESMYSAVVKLMCDVKVEVFIPAEKVGDLLHVNSELL